MNIYKGYYPTLLVGKNDENRCDEVGDKCPGGEGVEELVEAKVLRISPRALECIEDCANRVEQSSDNNWQYHP